MNAYDHLAPKGECSTSALVPARWATAPLKEKRVTAVGAAFRSWRATNTSRVRTAPTGDDAVESREACRGVQQTATRVATTDRRMVARCRGRRIRASVEPNRWHMAMHQIWRHNDAVASGPPRCVPEGTADPPWRHVGDGAGAPALVGDYASVRALAKLRARSWYC